MASRLGILKVDIRNETHEKVRKISAVMNKTVIGIYEEAIESYFQFIFQNDRKDFSGTEFINFLKENRKCLIENKISELNKIMNDPNLLINYKE